MVAALTAEPCPLGESLELAVERMRHGRGRAFQSKNPLWAETASFGVGSLLVVTFHTGCPVTVRREPTL